MIRLLPGDCRDVLPTLPADSVQCVVCSPPYYGLRDYQTGTWSGGDAACDHVVARVTKRSRVQHDEYRPPSSWTNRDATPPRQCSCGAVRIDRQIGLEATPDAYLATMVEVFREIRRVLRTDGTCWVNMGDSYATSPAGNLTPSTDKRGPGSYRRSNIAMDTTRVAKPKDLLLMPARLALALQADGWWVRSDIIWHKPNPMPESCTDRPTSAHEHVFLLTKSARYFFDNGAVREKVGEETRRNTEFRHAGYMQGQSYNNSGNVESYTPRAEPSLSGRSCRNVWTIATQAYPDAHFATYPSALAERCIRAGTSERGCCAACGKPWARVVERETVRDKRERLGLSMAMTDGYAARLDVGLQAIGGGNSHDGNRSPTVTTTGWSPGCKCNADVVPCTVLDPFAGAGTTLLVADRLQRDAIGIELNVDYTRMAMDRCVADAPLFTSFPPAEPPEDERMADLFADAAE